jgi:hypothetical protein
MKLPGLTVGTLCFVVAVVAVNLALLPLFFFDQDITWFAIIFMLNVLAFGFIRLQAERGRRQPFLVGFEITGLAVMLAYADCFWLFPGLKDDLRTFVGTYVEPIYKILFDTVIPAAFPIVAHVSPMLIVAVMGGILARQLASGKVQESSPSPPIPEPQFSESRP